MLSYVNLPLNLTHRFHDYIGLTLSVFIFKMYPVMPSFDSKPYFMMERSATCESTVFFPSEVV